jgi:spore coat polysaccharide biosynthesis protein SpsF
MKIGFFITARLKSTRLKKKILLDINGKTVIDRVIERAKSVKGIDGVVLCTSTNPQDAELKSNAETNGIHFFTGSEDDVLDRLHAAAQHFGYDAFVSITADNPLFSIYTSNLLVDLYKKNKSDFINTVGLPMGCATYIIDVKALDIVIKIKEHSDTEIWGPFINRADVFNIAELHVKNCKIDSGQRITLDYIEDLNLIQKLYSYFNADEIPSIQQIEKLFLTNKNLALINGMHKQLMLDEKIVKKIDAIFSTKKEEIRQYAESINKQLIPNKDIITVNL